MSEIIDAIREARRLHGDAIKAAVASAPPLPAAAIEMLRRDPTFPGHRAKKQSKKDAA